MNLRAMFFRKFSLAIFGVFLLNLLASVFYLYQSFLWFDMLMHFLGGIVVTFFAVWLLYHSYAAWRGTTGKILLINSLVFVLVGVLWEVMEFGVQHAFNIYGVLATPGDSVSDIICGLIGSWVALAYYFTKTSRHA